MSSTGASPRIDALDVTKGILVVLMVVYHSLNYSTQYQLPFRYLSFLPPSFILITGFLLSHIYLGRRSAAAPSSTTSSANRRLLARGAKLLVLFAALNVVGQFVRSQSYHGSSRGLGAWLDAWQEVFLWGGSRLATFDVLLPIAYLLLLAPALLWLTRVHRFALPAFTLALLGTCAWLERGGHCPPNLAFVTIGIVGMLIGLLSNAALNVTATLLPLSVLAYGAHFLLGHKLGQPFFHQLIGATLALMIFYGAGLHARSRAWTTRRLITLGQYSLIGYIGQIAILQIYSHFLGRPEPVSAALVLMLGVALALTVILVELTSWAQRQSKSFHLLYRAVIP